MEQGKGGIAIYNLDESIGPHDKYIFMPGNKSGLSHKKTQPFSKSCVSFFNDIFLYFVQIKLRINFSPPALTSTK